MPQGYSARGFARDLKVRQRNPHMIAARVDGTGTAAMIEGGNEITLTDNGTGDYTLTFAQPFKRIPSVVATPIGASGDVVCTIGTISVSAVQILCWDGTDGTTAKDADFHALILGFDDDKVV